MTTGEGPLRLPKTGGLRSLMEAGGAPSVVHVAAIACGFGFFIPLKTAMGRIHRFLIHNILARQGFTPEGIMFPVSSSMLKSFREYAASLEAFVHQLISLIKYELDEDGRMTVTNDTCRWYAYIEMTIQRSDISLYQAHDGNRIRDELSVLTNCDETKKTIRKIMDLPDRLNDLLIRFGLQNNGALGKEMRPV